MKSGMGEISFEARNQCRFLYRLIKFAITFYYCVEFLESATSPHPFVLSYNMEGFE